MITLVPSSIKKIKIEKAIMNSNPTFNYISTGTQYLRDEDIAKDHAEDLHIQKERYLTKKNDEYVGILEYTMENPNDQMPWLGLLVVNQNSQNKGIGREIYRIYEEEMRKRNVNEIRLGCMAENLIGLSFWEKQGFNKYKEMQYNERLMYGLKKLLL
ncbi:GNAT family N-acetyltransferase [Fredinandcohnia humi]